MLKADFVGPCIFYIRGVTIRPSRKKKKNNYGSLGHTAWYAGRPFAFIDVIYRSLKNQRGVPLAYSTLIMLQFTLQPFSSA